MTAAIRIIKRGDKPDADTSPAAVEPPVRSAKSEIVSTVKTWIAESRDRRRAAAFNQFLTLKETLGVSTSFEGSTNCVAFLLAAVFVLFIAPGPAWAQEPEGASLQTLTLDR